MKEVLKKIANILSVMFGYGILICLFAGGFTFFGYLVAIIIGGDIAVGICEFIYKSVTPIIIRTSTVLVLIGLVVMYLKGEKSLTSEKKKITKHQGEM